MSENKKENNKTKKPVESKLSLDTKAFNEFVKEFREESDRAAVILGVAKLDLLLYQILIKILFPNTSSNDDLFDGDAPLSTFSAKIHLCHRMGVIDSELTRALDLIRKIRNSFAHEVTGCDLDSGSHKDRVKELIAPFEIYDGFERMKKIGFSSQSSYSVYFRTALAVIVLRLEGIFNIVEPWYEEPFTLIPEHWLETKSSESSKKDDKS